MRHDERLRGSSEAVACKDFCAQIPAYVSGELSGAAMNRLASHLELCESCMASFGRERTTQAALASLRRPAVPHDLQARLQLALVAERERGSYLSWHVRVMQMWHAVWAPVALRAAAGTALALVLVAVLGFTLAAPGAVQANDDPMGVIRPPHYLYSVVPPQPVMMKHAGGGGSEPLVVEASVDREGRVYEYRLVAGPDSPETRRGVEANLLESLFQPATVFGVPIRGHVMMVYTAISVQG